MDEAARKLERRIEAEGDPLARVRLAQERLRAHDAAGALAALGEPMDSADADRLGLEAPARARALVALGRTDDALATLRRAADAGAALEGRAVLALLEPLIAGRSIVGRSCAAAIVGRLGDAGGEVAALRESLARDPDPLVRLALVRERPKFDPHARRTSRVFGSHGPDYETGVFVAFELPHDLRLRWFEPGLCASVNSALAALAPDATAIESLGLRTAFGEGYGLGGIPHPLDGGVSLEAAVQKLDALDVLPFRLHASLTARPYDLMEDESRLARRMAEDLRGHPARQVPFEKATTLLEKIVALHPLSGIPARREVLLPLLAEARGQLTPVGLRALEIFAQLRRGETQF